MIGAVCLKTEYLSNPSVIDIAFPRLFWKVQGAARQTASGCTVQAGGNHAGWNPP